MQPPTVPTDALLAESAWLRRLARRLVRDEARAEDAVQDTLVAALERERAGRVPGRPWLAAVLRNSVRFDARSGARRAAREAHAAAPDAPPPDEVVARLEAHRRLVEAVLALEEPYRTALALRFLEGLPPRAVARRTGVPVKTAHTRIDRALAKLKERLDRSFGRRDTWCAALAQLGRGKLALPLGLGTLGGAAMGSAIKWGGAAALLAAGGFLVQSRLSEPEAPSAPAPARAQEERSLAELDAPRAPEGPGGEAAPRTAVAAAAAGAAPAPAEPAAAPTFSGSVVDGAGRPVEGVMVVYGIEGFPGPQPELEQRSGRTDAGGIFRLPLQRQGGRLSVEDERWACVSSPGLAWMPPPEPPVVVVGPRRAYGGVVVDAAGEPVAGVELYCAPPGGTPEGEAAPHATSDAAGRFRCAAGFTPGLRLCVRSFVYRSTPLELPDADALDLVVAVERQLAEGALAGRVVDGQGQGVPGAYVSAGTVALQTDETGGFTLDPRTIPTAAARLDEIVAVHVGFQPARRSLAGLSPEERMDLRLELVERSLSIEGTVLDAEGAPVPKAIVWTFDATPFGVVPVEIEDGSWFGVPATMEGLATGNPYSESYLRADEQGRFELEGLMPRAYALYAMDPETLAAGGPLEVDAGERSAVLRLRGGERAGPVAGRVTNLAGAPLAGVHVDVYRRIDGPQGLRDPAGDFHAHAVTADDGAFRFPRMVLEGCHVVLRSPDGPWIRIELEREAHPEALELKVPEVRHVRVSVPGVCPVGSSFAFEDAGGELLETTSTSGTTRMVSTSHMLGTSLVATDERARFLVVLKGSEEIRRVPLELKRGEVTEVGL
jgi:RNA polymerase sigma-70 factor (ECF subfamily)